MEDNNGFSLITYALLKKNGGGSTVGKVEVVTELPEIGESGTIYLLPKEGTTPADNLYEEWLYVKGAWERLSSEVDLSNYYNKEEIDEKFDNLPPMEDQEAREMIQELSEDLSKTIPQLLQQSEYETMTERDPDIKYEIYKDI